ncbi:unnamed protein product [Parnassius mnemosyne]|uniref:Uncharacterized protein n=1 Tax=Parnassius mnemosyne TaxID=213953 RepID=A0AAV1M827_9NEOP
MLRDLHPSSIKNYIDGELPLLRTMVNFLITINKGIRTSFSLHNTALLIYLCKYFYLQFTDNRSIYINNNSRKCHFLAMALTKTLGNVTNQFAQAIKVFCPATVTQTNRNTYQNTATTVFAIENTFTSVRHVQNISVICDL